MTKGYKISVTFPANTLDFLEGVCKKLTKVKIDHPRTHEPMKHPNTGDFLYMSNTGGIEELVHGSILAAILPLLYNHPDFADYVTKIPKFREEYGNYITSMIQNHLTKGGVGQNVTRG